MKKVFFFIFTLIMMLTAEDVLSQEQAISRPEIVFEEDILSISYDIINSKKADKYLIALEITDESGKKILASSLSGDIGKDINGGSAKRIIWDLLADSIQMDAMLYFQVTALLTNPEIPKPSPVEDKKAEGKNAGVSLEAESFSRPVKTYNKGSLLAQSLVFPGLGLSKVKPGKPHWVKGVAAYSCIGGGILYMMKSKESYQAYQDSFVLEERTNYFNAARKEYVTSTSLFIGAASIWVIDFIWTLAGSNNSGQKLVKLPANIIMQPAYDNRSSTVLLTCQLRF